MRATDDSSSIHWVFPNNRWYSTATTEGTNCVYLFQWHRCWNEDVFRVCITKIKFWVVQFFQCFIIIQSNPFVFLIRPKKIKKLKNFFKFFLKIFKNLFEGRSWKRFYIPRIVCIQMRIIDGMRVGTRKWKLLNLLFWQFYMFQNQIQCLCDVYK